MRRAFFLRRFSRLQHLFDGVKKTIGIEQHQFVEIPPLVLGHLASLQGLQIKTNRGDGSLQFMGDRVDEAVMLLVAANFTDEKNRIEDEAGDYGAKKNDAEKHFDALTPVEDDPAAADRERQCREANAEREEKINCFLAARLEAIRIKRTYDWFASNRPAAISFNT
jgi:hypothetical protein